MYKAGRKSESSFSHLLLAVFPLLIMQQISSFFKQVCFFKKMLTCCWFSSIECPNPDIRHDNRSKYNRQESERSENR